MIFPICLQKYFRAFFAHFGFPSVIFSLAGGRPHDCISRDFFLLHLSDTREGVCSRLNYFRLPYTFIFAAKILLFSHISKKSFSIYFFCHHFAIPQTGSLFLKRGPRKFAICGESGGISRLNVATQQSCDLLPNAHIRWLLRSACLSRPFLCQLPAVQHNTSGGVARYPARSVFEYTLFTCGAFRLCGWHI